MKVRLTEPAGPYWRQAELDRVNPAFPALVAVLQEARCIAAVESSIFFRAYIVMRLT